MKHLLLFITTILLAYQSWPQSAIDFNPTIKGTFVKKVSTVSFNDKIASVDDSIFSSNGEYIGSINSISKYNTDDSVAYLAYLHSGHKTRSINLLLELSQGRANNNAKKTIQDGGFERDKVVQLDSTSKNELYIAFRVAISNLFKSGKAVTDLEDKESGRFIGKGIIPLGNKFRTLTIYERHIKLTIDLTAKDNKYRIILKDVYFSQRTDKEVRYTDFSYADMIHFKSQGINKKWATENIEEVEKCLTLFLSGLEVEISNAVKANKKDF